MSGVSQGMPSRSTAFQDKDGLISAQWYVFVHNLWLRTGGAFATGNITEVAAQVATLNSEVTTINGQITTINGQITTLNGEVTTINGEITAIGVTTDSLGTYVALADVQDVAQSDPAWVASMMSDA